MADRGEAQTWNPGFEVSGFLARAEKEREPVQQISTPCTAQAWCRPGHVFPRSFACAGFVGGFPTRPNTSTRRVKRVLGSEDEEKAELREHGVPKRPAVISRVNFADKDA